MGFFSSKNSILLVRDPVSTSSLEGLEEEILEIRKYYTFGTLTEVSERIKSRKSQGIASYVFINPRKYFFMQIHPLLQSLKIPFSMMLRPECVGSNRLPITEEIKYFQTAYPDQMTQLETNKLIDLFWHEPVKAEEKWYEFRKKIGPLPIDNMNPLDFFSTWGKLLEISPLEMDVGYFLSSSLENKETHLHNIRFIETQLSRRVAIGYLPKIESLPEDFIDWKLDAVVTESTGEIGKNTKLPWLPKWDFK